MTRYARECDNAFVLSWVYILFTLNLMGRQPSLSLSVPSSLAVKSKEIEDSRLKLTTSSQTGEGESK